MEMLGLFLDDFPYLIGFYIATAYDKKMLLESIDSYHNRSNNLSDERVCWGGEGQAVPTLVGSSRSLRIIL